MVLCLKTWKSRTSPGYNKTSFNEKLYCSNWWSWFCWIKSNKTTLKKNKKKIISLDDYSSGSVRNHIRNNRVIYIKGNTIYIKKKLKKFEKKIYIHCFILVNFQEFIKVLKNLINVYQSNTHGSNQVFKFCLENKIKLIYSATSASFGKNRNDKNLSPYAFSKSKNLEFLENLKNGLILNLK